MKNSSLIGAGATVTRDFPADVLKVRVAIKGKENTREECISAYNCSLAEVQKAIIGLGIPSGTIKNDFFSVSARTEKIYARVDEGDCDEKDLSCLLEETFGEDASGDSRAYYVAKTVLSGYEYSSAIDIECEPSAELAKDIWIALIGCADNVEFGLSFSLKDFESAKSKLLAEAVAEGRRCAEIIASASGAIITGLRSADYEYIPSRRQGPGDVRAMRGAPSRYENAPGFSPSDITVMCSIQMQWYAEPVS